MRLTRCVVERCDLEAAAVTAHEHEALAVGQRPRRHVVGTFERQPLDPAGGDVRAIDLRRAAAVGCEQQRPAVRRKRGLGVDARRREDARRIAAIRIHHVNLRAAVLGERDGEPAAIRRPCRRTVAAAEIGERQPLARRERLHVDDGFLVLERHVREPRAVGRPLRRKQRLVRRDYRLRIGAVGVRDEQLVARSLLGDVGDARREDAGIAGHLFVDDIGDLVRRGAELRRRDDVAHRREDGLLHDVDERETDLDPAIRERPQRTDDDRVRVAGAPRRGLDILRAERPRCDGGGVDQPEQPRAGEVGADDAADAERIVAFVFERDEGDGNGRARAADDLDRQLRLRRRDVKQRKRQEDGQQVTRKTGHQAQQ